MVPRHGSRKVAPLVVVGALLVTAIAQGRAPSVGEGAGRKARSAPVLVYRGLHVDPEKYDPKRWASEQLALGRRKVPDIWVHQRLSGALSYAGGWMTRNLVLEPKRRLKVAMVLELEMPEHLIRWEYAGAERGYFDRRRVVDDRKYIKRVGLYRLGRKPVLSWMSAEEFFRTRSE